MKYNFETFQDRRNLGSSKYELMLKQKPDVSGEIVPLSTADMEFNIAPEIQEGLKEFITDAILGYQIPTDSYKKAVVNWFKKRYNTDIKPEWITTSSGVVNGFNGGVLAFSKPGDGVILMPPVYGPFFAAIENHNRKPVACNLIEEDNYYKIDFDKFEELAKDENNKILMFCNPHNPAGRVWAKEELEKLAEIALANDLIIISDEIHSDFILSGNEFTSFLNVSEEILNNLLVCHAPNKTFNIAGLSAGNNIVPNPELKEIYDETMNKYRLQGTNSLALKATEIAYTKCEEWVDELVKVIEGNIDYFIERVEKQLPEIRVFKPEGGYLVWMDMCPLGYSGEELDEILINEAELFLNPGSFFKVDGDCYKRVNLACPRYVVEDSVDRLVKTFQK